MPRIFGFIVCCGLVITTGCRSDPSSTPVDATHLATTEPASIPSAGSTLEGKPTQMTPPLKSPLDSALQAMIQKARTDLSQRLSVSGDQINLLEAKSVTWADSSIGCPQEGMAYTQVLTPGYVVVLEHNNNRYEYHAGKGMAIFYCTNPTPPALDTPDNT